MAAKWTADEIRSKMATDQRWLERGVTAIFEYQTRHEQDREQTELHNDVGFNAADARYLSYAAKWLIGGRRPSGRHVAKARRMMAKYAGQLARIANGEQK